MKYAEREPFTQVDQNNSYLNNEPKWNINKYVNKTSDNEDKIINKW